MSDNPKRLKDLRVADLKHELEKRDLQTSGVKAVLAERLKTHLESQGVDIEKFDFNKSEEQSLSEKDENVEDEDEVKVKKKSEDEKIQDQESQVEEDNDEDCSEETAAGQSQQQESEGKSENTDDKSTTPIEKAGVYISTYFVADINKKESPKTLCLNVYMYLPSIGTYIYICT